MTAPAPEHLRPLVADAVRIWFRFVPRPGWLPYDTEGLWAEPAGAGTARIRNVPFLQNGVAPGDVVRYQAGGDGLLWARERVERSGHCVIRVLPAAAGPLAGSAAEVHGKFAPYGLGGEVYSEALPLVALDVPPGADHAGIKALLLAGRADGWWSFEEGSTTEEWRAA